MSPAERIEIGKRIVEKLEIARHAKLESHARAQVLGIIDDVLMSWVNRQVIRIQGAEIQITPRMESIGASE